MFVGKKETNKIEINKNCHWQDFGVILVIFISPAMTSSETQNC